MSKLWAERLTALGMILVAGIFLVQSLDFPQTSGAFPQFTAYAIMVLAVIMILRSYLTRSEKLAGDVRFDFSYIGLKPIYVMIVTIIYAYTVFQVGFYVTSFVFFFLVSWMTGIRNVKMMAMVAAVLFPLMYLFFTIALDADLPEGILI